MALTSNVSVFTAFTFTAVHTKTHRRRFQVHPLWRAFSNLCVYGERFHRLRVDGRPKRIKKFAFTSVCVYNRLRVDGAVVVIDCIILLFIINSCDIFRVFQRKLKAGAKKM